eukprot:gnl/TRDRNA2_/TRDRNA2_71472_c0_seq1.p1 gnl/TRDRNA2_/TRDRNA2_71472_c0~~gnl/TRDRNA2_/TRDRNA2_71472_c0_seq1.p1  ORF type:complete len:151 (-),score=4.89 gnl/TRDRNA2_/TRDRNA2_71472_c0_seq1:75-527(-)
MRCSKTLMMASAALVLCVLLQGCGEEEEVEKICYDESWHLTEDRNVKALKTCETCSSMGITPETCNTECKNMFNRTNHISQNDPPLIPPVPLEPAGGRWEEQQLKLDGEDIPEGYIGCNCFGDIQEKCTSPDPGGCPEGRKLCWKKLKQS